MRFNEAVDLVLAQEGRDGSPIGRPAVVLDIGAGQCEWLRTFSGRYPNLDLHALDVFSQPSDLPPAITHHQQSASQLPFANKSVDLVHARKILSSLEGGGSLIEVVKEASRCLRKGGLVVFVEGRNAGSTIANSPRGLLVKNLARNHLSKSGLDNASLTESLPALLSSHGFLNVREEMVVQGGEGLLQAALEGQAPLTAFWGCKG